MAINPLLQAYVPLVEYLGQAFGENCEVILHDLTNIEHSIVAIANGHLTGRGVGGHITDFGLEVVHNPYYKDKAFAAGYPGSTPDHTRKLRSSTYFIRDEAGNTIGLLCMNVDITDMLAARDVLTRLTAMATDGTEPAHPAAESAPIQETFSLSVEEMMTSSVERIMAGYAMDPQRLTIDEKKSIVEQLQGCGIFSLKGGVGMIARRLNISEPTIYRYLREMQSDK